MFPFRDLLLFSFYQRSSDCYNHPLQCKLSWLGLLAWAPAYLGTLRSIQKKLILYFNGHRAKHVKNLLMHLLDKKVAMDQKFSTVDPG